MGKRITRKAKTKANEQTFADANGNGGAPSQKKPKPISGADLTKEVLVVGGPNSLYSRRGLLVDEFDPPDRVIASSTQSFRLYQEMANDPFVEGALAQKKYRALSPGWEIVAPDAEEASQRNRDFVEQEFKNLTGGFENFLYCTLDALDMGFSISEQTYRLNQEGDFAGKLGLAHIKAKDPRSLGFRIDEFNNIIGLRTRADHSALLPVNKFLIFTWMPRYSSPWGRSDLRTAYRAWFIKKVAWKLRAMNAERKVTPPIVGRVPQGTADEIKTAYLETLEELQHNSVLILEEGIEFDTVKLLGDQNSEYGDMIKDLNQEILIGILGSFLAAGEGTSTGSRALGEVHSDVTDLFVKALRRKLEDDIRDQVIERLVRLNFQDGAIPRFEFQDQESEDIKTKIETDTFLLKANVALSEDYFYDTYSRPKPEPGQNVIQSPPGIVGGMGMPGGGGPITLKPEGDDPNLNPEPELEEPDMASIGEPSEFAEGFWRNPTTFEEKNAIQSIADFLDQHQALTIEGMGPAYQAIIDKALEAVQKAYSVQGKLNPRKVKLDKVSKAPLERVLRKSMLTANARGYADVMAIIQRGDLGSKAIDAGLEINRKKTPVRIENFQEPTDLVGLLEVNEVAKHLRDLIPMSAAAFNQLLATFEKAARDNAFTVAGLELATIQRDVQGLVVRAANEGWGFDTFRDALNERAVRYVKPVFGKAGTVGEKVLDHHAENVFRTNIIRGYNQARKDAQADPIVRQILPGREYSAILDDRTTGFCRQWDGFKAPASDPIWDQITPPNHFQCRSITIAIDFEDWSPEQASASKPPIAPQSGFGVTGGDPFN